MLSAWLLLTIGVVTGVVTRIIVGGKAYGSVADAMLGITGAFFVNWVLELLIKTTMSWSSSALFTIWGAAAFPLVAHFWARHQTARHLEGSSKPLGFFRERT